MHIGDFLAVINGYAGDSDHPCKLLMHTRRKSGKVAVLGRRELVPSSSLRRVCPVWHGGA